MRKPTEVEAAVATMPMRQADRADFPRLAAMTARRFAATRPMPTGRLVRLLTRWWLISASYLTFASAGVLDEPRRSGCLV